MNRSPVALIGPDMDQLGRSHDGGDGLAHHVGR